MPNATVFRVTLAASLIVTAGCSDSNNSGAVLPQTPTDFTAIQTSMQAFVDTQPSFDGASLIIVDKNAGVIHRAFVGDHDIDTVVLLASTSKMPAAALMMALHEDDANVDFEIDRVIDDYLPYTGAWPGRTAEQLVSNTSGIPGLGFLGQYGAHLCQYVATGQLQECGKLIYQTPLDELPSYAPGTNFDYGGSPWQLAGLVAEVVGGASWNQLFDQYLGEPCDLDVFRFGNMLAQFDNWTGHPDSLVGLDNPNIEGGAISNLDDYAKLLSMHLNDGWCGDNQVLSAESVDFMRVDRARATGTIADDARGYGMGWWVTPKEDGAEPTLFLDPGAFGAVSWIDIDREYGAFFAVEVPISEGQIGSGYAREELLPLVEAAYDAVRD